MRWRGFTSSRIKSFTIKLFVTLSLRETNNNNMVNDPTVEPPMKCSELISFLCRIRSRCFVTHRYKKNVHLTYVMRGIQFYECKSMLNGPAYLQLQLTWTAFHPRRNINASPPMMGVLIMYAYDVRWQCWFKLEVALYEIVVRHCWNSIMSGIILPRWIACQSQTQFHRCSTAVQQNDSLVVHALIES